MDNKALQLGARFTLPPNSLGYCGKDTAPERFKNCFIKGDCTGVAEEFEHFIVLHPYLKTLAEITKKEKLSYEVIEAYWLGNDLLKQAKNEHYDILLENFSQQGVPQWLVEELKEKRPKKFLPFHLFQILHVGVGKASGSVPFDINSINNCMIRWGEVKNIKSKKLTINLNSLKKEKNSYKLIQKEETFSYNPEFFTNLKRKDVMSVHWQQPVKILSKKEVKQLDYWTKDTLESF